MQRIMVMLALSVVIWNQTSGGDCPTYTYDLPDSQPTYGGTAIIIDHSSSYDNADQWDDSSEYDLPEYEPTNDSDYNQGW